MFLKRRPVRMAEDGAGSAGDEGSGKETPEDGTTVLGEGGDETADDSTGEGDDAGKEGDGDTADAKKDDTGSDEDEAEDDGEGEDDGGEKPGEFDMAAFEVPEGTEIDETWMGKLTGNEAIQKLNQTEVQGLIGMVGEFVAERDAARITAQNVRTKEWADDLQKNEFVTERGMEKVAPLARAARDEFFPGINDLFNETGLGSHPTMVVGMARIAEALSLLESTLDGGGEPARTGGSESAAHKLFPDHAPGGKYAGNAA